MGYFLFICEAPRAPGDHSQVLRHVSHINNEKLRSLGCAIFHSPRLLYHLDKTCYALGNGESSVYPLKLRAKP
jgi:hypothetical protein